MLEFLRHCSSVRITARLVNFEDEKEVKQHLDNKGVEFSYQCYREKDPEGCQRLADYMEGVKENVESTTQGKLQIIMAYSCFMTAYSSGGKNSVDACQNVGLLTDVG
ncbi:LOW QUALITY PROTEIN: cytochrome c oxidase assembly factor 7-like [Salvelinus alpinus]